MWPKRKIQLVAPSEAPGIEGVRAFLSGIQLEFCEVEPATEDISKRLTESWFEKPFDCSSTALADELDKVTELVFWPEGTEDGFRRQRALAQGADEQSIQSFIHNILDNELIIPLAEPIVFLDGRPMLGHILNEAGYEPTILWSTPDGKWQCEKRQGLYWLLPESWLEVVALENSSIMETVHEKKATWVIRETGVSFYREQDGLKFVGQIPRWAETPEEQAVYQDIASCIDLGVSWLDIRLALNSPGDSKITTDNLRWNNNDIGWSAWACGEKLPAGPPEYMENWWAR